MPDLKELLDQAAAAAAPVPPIPIEVGPHWAHVALESLAEWLNEKYPTEVHARVEGAGVPEVSRLILSPKTRPNEGMNLLVVHGAGHQAMSLGQGQTHFRSPEELDQFIVRLVVSPNFQSTLAAISSRNEVDVEAYLRTAFPRDRDPQYDVFVGVPANIQREIAAAYWRKEARAIAPFRVELLRSSPIAAGKLTGRENTLRWLVTGGIVVEIALPIQVMDPESAARFGGTVRFDL